MGKMPAGGWNVLAKIESALVNRDSGKLSSWMPLAEQLGILSPVAAELGVLARWATTLGISASASKEEVQELAITAISENFVQLKREELRRQQIMEFKSSEGNSPSRPLSPSASDKEELAQLEKDAEIFGVKLDEIEIPPPSSEPSKELPAFEEEIQ